MSPDSSRARAREAAYQPSPPRPRLSRGWVGAMGGRCPEDRPLLPPEPAVTLKEACQILGLGPVATRREIREAYRRAARRWHPDRAPAGAEEEYRRRMQAVNAAYQRLKEFLEHYRYRLEETEEEGDVDRWWRERFNVGVWSGPGPAPTEGEE